MDPDVRTPLPEALLLQCRDPHRHLQDGVAHVRHLRGRAWAGRGLWCQPSWDPGGGWSPEHLRPGCSRVGRGEQGKGNFCVYFVRVAALGGAVLVPQLGQGLSRKCWMFLALPHPGHLGEQGGHSKAALCCTDSWFSLSPPLLQPHDIRAQVSATRARPCPPVPNPWLSPGLALAMRATPCFVPALSPSVSTALPVPMEGRYWLGLSALM